MAAEAPTVHAALRQGTEDDKHKVRKKVLGDTLTHKWNKSSREDDRMVGSIEGHATGQSHNNAGTTYQWGHVDR